MRFERCFIPIDTVGGGACALPSLIEREVLHVDTLKQILCSKIVFLFFLSLNVKIVKLPNPPYCYGGELFDKKRGYSQLASKIVCFENGG